MPAARDEIVELPKGFDDPFDAAKLILLVDGRSEDKALFAA